jgi:predicted choloylglycine hydrolase
LLGVLVGFRVAVVECRGTPYDVGRQQAALFAESPKGQGFRRRKSVRLPWWFDIKSCEKLFAGISPALWEEIGGIAEGLGVSMERAVLAFGTGGLRPLTGGCSAIMAAGAYGRNYDFRPQHYGARLALVQARGSYASIGFSELLTGRLDGMNECGLSIGLHLVNGKPIRPGLSCVLIVRLALDQCATAEEACALLQRLPHAMQYNYSMLDSEGNAAVVEATPGAIAVRTGVWLACTNHFQSPRLAPHNRRAEHSRKRLPTLETWAREGLSADAVFANLNWSASPAFHHGYDKGAGTLHTIVSEPARRRILIGVGGDAASLGTDMLDVGLDNWTYGRNIGTTQLTGQLGGQTKAFQWPIRRG